MKKLVLMLSLLLVVASCGSDSGGVGEATAETISKTQYKSGNCGSDVISDYNSFVTPCAVILDRDDIKECEDLLVQFKDKYPGINCMATTGTGLNEEELLISTEHIESLLNMVRNL